MYYFYGKSNRGHGICLLYRGCPPFGESVIRGFTVYVHVQYIIGSIQCAIALDLSSYLLLWLFFRLISEDRS